MDASHPGTLGPSFRPVGETSPAPSPSDKSAVLLTITFFSTAPKHDDSRPETGHLLCVAAAHRRV
ncbi:hypothetical protein QC763_0070400 [Podospora pseudopauciseta]|uniref:Uncharacterized protein n=1 Tax=Podospora pseudopauciseta TaxID=2093780 RepID=A0ABR0HE93_9PEZI|nr:hypothetical protein QC763_0070400 [Podospora pseudopauciseta]